MYLEKIKLWNFRKFGSDDNLIDSEKDGELRNPDVEIKFNKNLNVLIGENDAGKTAVVDAIKMILKTHAPEWIQLKQEDFFTGTNNLRIECIFKGLSSDEARHFIEWLGFENENSENPFLKINIQAKKNDEKVFYHEVKAGADSEGYTLSGEAKDYLKTVYLKPLRDAKTELIPKKNSRLSQVLQGHETFKGKEKTHKLIDYFQKLKEKINEYFDSDIDGKKPRDGINNILKPFFKDDKNVIFSITNKNEIKEILEILKIALNDEKMGLGSHNLLFMATELLNLKRTDWDGIRLGLIEELEAHLHPQAQMRVIESLKKESEENNVQFILTTHSPNIGSKVLLKNLFICEGQNIFSMKKGETKLEKSDYKFLERFLDVTKANLFFANGVILVEGWAEELIIPVLAEKIGINLTQKGVSVINVAGTAFLRYAKIFQRNAEDVQMSIPVSIITDLDIKSDKYNEEKPEVKTEKDFNLTEKITEKETKYSGQVVKSFISPKWTLEYCLALNSSLSEILYESVVGAVKEMRDDGTTYAHAEITETYRNFIIDKNQEEIAFYIYYNLIIKKQVSKSIIAQVFSQKLEKPEIEIVEDENIKYLLDAIKYAAGESTNPSNPE